MIEVCVACVFYWGLKHTTDGSSYCASPHIWNIEHIALSAHLSHHYTIIFSIIIVIGIIIIIIVFFILLLQQCALRICEWILSNHYRCAISTRIHFPDKCVHIEKKIYHSLPRFLSTYSLYVTHITGTRKYI